MHSEPCLTGVFSLCFFLFVTIWVTSFGVGSAKGQLRRSSVLPHVFGVPKWFTMLPPSDAHPPWRIARGIMSMKSVSEFPGGKSPVRFRSGEPLEFVVRSVLASSAVDPNTLYSLRHLDGKKSK